MAEVARVLIADDEEPFRELLRRRLARQGHTVTALPDGEAAVAAIREEEFDIALLDLAMPGFDGIEVLKALKETQPDTEAIILTGQATVDTAIEAMKLGAYDYLEKPVKSSELQLTIERALEKRRLARENLAFREDRRRREAGLELVGASPAMQELAAIIEKVAPTASPVLIQGDSGVGKELVANMIHRQSARSEVPLIAINCGALQETLLENEIFGHVRGAFTGADSEQVGIFEMADGGTLFIDEICEMSHAIQAKFLRVLENGEFRRVGEARTRHADVRILAATNRDLATEVSEGRFRRDLYYRLNVVNITIPPLRERREDIPLLVSHFLGRDPRAAGMTVQAEVMSEFARYDWPGNVRELSNILERAVILCAGDEITLADIPELCAEEEPEPADRPPESKQDGPLTLDQLEKTHIAETLRACDGNRTLCAQALGISLRSLYRKLTKHDLI